MKFCPECGSKLNGEKVCPMCTYDIEKQERENKEEIKRYQTDNNLFKEPVISFNNHIELTEEEKEELSKKEISLETLKNKKIDTGELIRISYQGGGGMMGGHHSKTLDFETKTLETVNQDFHYSDTFRRTYSVTDEDLNRVKELITNNNLPAWSMIPKSDMVIFDYVPTRIYLTYEKGRYELPDSFSLNNEENDILMSLSKLIGTLLKDENLKDEQITEGSGFNPMGLYGMAQDNNLNNNSRFCPSCGAIINDNDEVCKACNTKLNQ